MELTNCPMCQSSIPSESNEPINSCAVCGADLTRYMTRSSTPPPSARAVEGPSEGVSEFNLTHGILGALGGAAIGVGAMFGFYELAQFRFPLLGVGIGLLTGYGAKLLYKGTDNTLGIIAGGIALVAVAGTLYLMYGDFPPINIISAVVSVSVAYKVATR
jgi:hypothetical protein